MHFVGLHYIIVSQCMAQKTLSILKILFASEISSRQEAQPLKQRNNNCIAKVQFQEGEDIYLL